MKDLRSLTTAPAESNLSEPLLESPSQTAGPYVHIGCFPNLMGIENVYDEDLTCNQSTLEGPPLILEGTIYDGAGEAAKDLMIESWQADASGDVFKGIWRRTRTDLQTGVYRLETIFPGAKTGAPHLRLWIVARGINLGLTTRVFFDDHLAESDPYLSLVDTERQKTIIARNTGNSYHFDIYLQGERETVFFDD